MRLCFVIYSLSAGGAERVLSQLANHFAQKGAYDVHVVTLQPEGTPPFYPLDSNITLHQLGLNQTGGLFGKVARVFNRLVAIRQAIRQINPSKIISFIDEMNVAVLLATFGFRSDIIISERIDPRRHKINFVTRILRRFLYPFSRALVVQGGYIKDYFSYMRHKCFVIANPIPTVDVSYDAAQADYKVLSVGRLSPQKDHRTLIQAFSRLVSKYPSWSLEIYGKGPERASLEALIKDLSLEDKVFLRGVTPNIQDKLKKAAIFAFPSLFEGFPNALGEAMSAGVPVIASNCEGNLELVHHEKTGLVFPMGDQESLTAQLEALMTDSEKRKSLGKSAKKSIETFAPEKIFKQWEVVLE